VLTWQCGEIFTLYRGKVVKVVEKSKRVIGKDFFARVIGLLKFPEVIARLELPKILAFI